MTRRESSATLLTSSGESTCKCISRNPVSFGKNTRKLPKLRSFGRVLLDQFEDQLLRILLYTGLLSLFLSYFSSQEYKYLESVSIFFAVALATTIQAVCSFGKDR